MLSRCGLPGILLKQKLDLFGAKVSSLETAMKDVKNPNQYDRVKDLLEKVTKDACCEPEGRDQVVIARAMKLQQDLKHMHLLKKAIANLNQKTIAIIRSFDQPLPEIVDCMTCVFLLL